MGINLHQKCEKQDIVGGVTKVTFCYSRTQNVGLIEVLPTKLNYSSLRPIR